MPKNATFVKLSACIAWLTLAVTSAAPANARALTLKSGDYAVCSANYSVRDHSDCNGFWPYYQNIRFNSTTCNSSDCSSISGTTYVESIYSYGRKPAIPAESCSAMLVYQLGACAC